MGATGESVRRLTDFGFNPAWSPDGKEIVFSTARWEDPLGRYAFNSQLWVVNAGSGEKRQLTKPDTVPDAAQPNWSPHGHRISYWAVAGGQRDIWTIAADGTHPVAVTQDAALDWSPAWSPDGGYLYFASDRGGSMNLWRVRIDERSGRVLGRPGPVTTPSPYSGSVSVSRDGKRIADVQQLVSTHIQKVGFDPRREIVVPPLANPGLAAVAYAPTLAGWRMGGRNGRLWQAGRYLRYQNGWDRASSTHERVQEPLSSLVAGR